MGFSRESLSDLQNPPSPATGAQSHRLQGEVWCLKDEENSSKPVFSPVGIDIEVNIHVSVLSQIYSFKTHKYRNFV